MKKNTYLQYLIIPIFSFIILSSLFVNDAFAQQGGIPAGSGATFQNPIAYNTVDELLGNVLKTVQSIVAILAVLMIVVGGIIYITSAGNQGRVDLAKKAVTAAIIGLALALAAPAFLHQIYTIFGATTPGTAPAANKTLSQIIFDTLQVLLGIIGTLSVLMLVVGGIMYMISGGDETRAETAKNIIKYAIIGLIVAILSLVIVTQVINLF